MRLLEASRGVRAPARPSAPTPRSSTPSNGPAWLHGKMTKTEVTAMIDEAGLDQGKFMVWKRDDKPNQWAMTVVYKGKQTHHLIAQDDDTKKMTVGKKSYGDFDSLEGLIEGLRGSVPGWPVPLKDYVARAASGAKLTLSGVTTQETTTDSVSLSGTTTTSSSTDRSLGSFANLDEIVRLSDAAGRGSPQWCHDALRTIGFFGYKTVGV